MHLQVTYYIQSLCLVLGFCIIFNFFVYVSSWTACPNQSSRQNPNSLLDNMKTYTQIWILYEIINLNNSIKRIHYGIENPWVFFRITKIHLWHVYRISYNILNLYLVIGSVYPNQDETQILYWTIWRPKCNFW